VLSGSEVLLEIAGLEVMAEGVRAGTHSESWRERVPDCDAETTGAKGSADKRKGKQTGMMSMQS